MKKKITISILSLILLVGAVFVVLGIGTAEIVARTGDDKFCSSCHVMEPMVTAFKNDTHGGNNSVGFQAKCVDCHLSHDNTLSYMIDKTYKGTKDMILTVFTNEENIDFYEKRNHREDYVYDSGCLSCHKKLLAKDDLDNPKGVEMHQHYLSKKDSKDPLQCVSCHVTVGHDGSIRNELNKTKPEYKFGKERLERGLPMSEDEQKDKH